VSRASLVALLALAACGSEPLRVLTYNVGNADGSDAHYALRLSDQAYEDFVGARIRAVGADLVFLQEVLPPHTCASFVETSPARTCFDAANRPAPVERLLGDGYSIVCDMRLQVECIGVRRGFGTIRGVPAGGFVLMGADTPPLPLPPCSYAGGECDDTRCDAEATVSAIDVDTASGPLRVVHLHPNAPGEGARGFYLGEACRRQQLAQAFDGLVRDGIPNVLAGDTNLDLEIFASQEEAALWAAHVGDGKRFTDHSQTDSTGAFLPTRRVSIPVAIDKVLTDAFTGRCTVHGNNETSSAPPAVPPLDDGFDFAALDGGLARRIDHLAVSCDLTRRSR
jgi:hypothetical protein